jgi:hypothetical protein
MHRLLALALLLLLVDVPLKAQDAAPPTLELHSLLAKYPQGAPPVLRLSLRLAADAGQPWALAPPNWESVQVVSLVQVMPSGTVLSVEPWSPPLDCLDEPTSPSSTVMLKPGERLVLPLDISPDPNAAAFVLSLLDLSPVRSAVAEARVTRPVDSSKPSGDQPLTATEIEQRTRAAPPVPIERRYKMTVPGIYRLRLRYEYRGPDLQVPNLFRGPLESNEITFELS